MKIGITISLHQNSIWASGVNQNGIYLALVLKEGGHDVTLITSNAETAGSASQVLDLCKEYKLKTIKVDASLSKYYNIIIDLGFWISNNTLAAYKTKNPNVKLISYNCGNNFLIESETILFNAFQDRYKDYLDESFGGQPSKPDQVWLIPQMENTNKDWNKYVFDTENVTVIPFIWEPIATEMYCKEKGYGEYVKRPITKIASMEANISVMKHFLPNIVTVEELLKRGVNIEKFFIMSADRFLENKRIPQIIRNKRISKKGFMSFNPRIPTQDMIHDHADLVLSWQWENNLNYLYLDAAWMGAPVVHNANLCPDLGYYYNGFEMHAAADMVEEAIKSHPTDETYLERSREIIKRYTHNNKNLVEQYNMLIDNVMKDQFVEMTYNWEDNSVSPK